MMRKRCVAALCEHSGAESCKKKQIGCEYQLYISRSLIQLVAEALGLCLREQRSAELGQAGLVRQHEA
eukprot:1845371-Pleurochrysis_carterae.AAC.7